MSSLKEKEKEKRQRITLERKARRAAREENKRRKKDRRQERLRLRVGGAEISESAAVARSSRRRSRPETRAENSSSSASASTDISDRADQPRAAKKTHAPHPISCEDTIRLAIVGCGSWFCNRAHLPALAKIINKRGRKHQSRATSSKENDRDFNIAITVLCGSSDAADKALSTLRRNGIHLTLQGEAGEGPNNPDAVARFDNLKDYLEFERCKRIGADDDENEDTKLGTSPPRSQVLADVCLLCLPIPKMIEGIGMSLRAGKYVISEKPASPNLSKSRSLWEACRCLRASERWIVSENWAHKPSLATMRRHLHAEIIRQERQPTSYSLEVCQNLDNSGWREKSSTLYDGGAARDVGAHAIRVLRRLFGEVDIVSDCKYTTTEDVISLEGKIYHDNFTSGNIATECKDKIDPSEQKAVITVQFGELSSLVWDIARSTIERHDEPSKHELLSRIEGDSWIHGGVKDTLEEAFDVFARGLLKEGFHLSGYLGPKCSPEEALRDVAVLDAMIDSGKSSGDRVLVQQFRPLEIANYTTAPVFNSTKTAQYQPAAVAHCASASDVVAATQWAASMDLFPEPVGNCNSSNALNSGTLWIDPHLMSRVLGFQVDLDNDSALIRVEAGFMLSDLCAILKPTGFTLPSLPILLDQTIGGALATGSHGSSAMYGTLSDSVVEMNVVLPSGELLAVVEQENKRYFDYNDNKVLESPSLLKAVRCGVGQLGTTIDVTLRLIRTPRVRKREVELNMSNDNIASQVRELLLSSHHCWVHWRLPCGDNDDGKAIAILLESSNDYFMVEPGDGQEYVYSEYSARSWYPDGPMMKSLWQTSRRRVAGELKYTLQWSFPISSLELLISRVSRIGAHLESRVVELKGLAASEKTFLAPNSIEGGSSVARFVALNAWFDSKNDDIMLLLERGLVDIPGARPHPGKWVSGAGLLHLDGSKLSSEFDGIKRNICRPKEKDKTTPILSVIVPVYNAMPWLPLAVRDVLKQELEDGKNIEVVIGDDCSTDGSLTFLVDVAILLGKRGSIEAFCRETNTTRVLTSNEAKALSERRRNLCSSKKKSINPALSAPERGAELSRQASDLVPSTEAEICEKPLSASEVAAATYSNTRLRVIVLDEDLNTGQGAVMTRCLRLCQAPYIGHMESDDERPDGAFQTMLCELRCHPEWDGVTSLTQCIGWEAEGMQRYVAWQNSCSTPEMMQRSQFLEIPSMHQAGIFRVEAVHAAIGGKEGCFKDDPVWAVDIHFWLSFFEKGLVCGKVPKVLFHWRQHPGQQTRNHGRLSIENLRKCKCHFLCKERGWIWRDAQDSQVCVEVWSSGNTLQGYVEDMRNELSRLDKSSQCSVLGVEWRPSQPIPSTPASIDCGAFKRVRLFAFGMEKARQKATKQIKDWDHARDIFVS